jgi:S-formylglutathione hydrolase
MATYVERELPALVKTELPADMTRQSIMGHSMGGHGALTIALRNQDRYASVSALSPICSPMNCPWGEKALTGYLGSNKKSWETYDACALLEHGARLRELLVDQGVADQIPGYPTQASASGTRVRQSEGSASAAHARRL